MSALRRLFARDDRGMRAVRFLSCMLVLGLVVAVLGAPAQADDTGGIEKPTRGGMTITVSVADGVAITTPGQTGGWIYRRNSNVDSSFALRASTPTLRRTDTFFSDTIGLTTENSGIAAPTTDTTRKITQGETGVYILSVTNLGNGADSIGFVIDSAVVNGLVGLDTMFQWSVHFYDSRGVILATVRTRNLDTVFLRLDPSKSETISIRAYGDSEAPETSFLVFRVRTYVANGNPNQFAIRSFRGFNGDTYGGDGHDSITLYMELKAPSKLRVSKTDTVVAGLSLGGSTATSGTDTQHRIPGAIVVNTIWFDNDDSATVDTIILEEWIDTRFVLFDSAGLANPAGIVPQTAVAGTYVINSYGHIFRDSAMPTDTSATAEFRVKIEYYESTGLASLAATTPPARVGRIRWTITKVNGSGSLLAAHNGNDPAASIDAAPVGIKAATDYDMGYVRYAVVIRSDSSAAKGPGRPDSGHVVGGDNGVAGVDSAFIEVNLLTTSRVTFVNGFTAEFLPNVDLVPETQAASKIQQSAGDTFYFAHKIGNSGNGADSIALTGTTSISGAYVALFRDIGGIGSFDGFEQKIDTFTVKENDTVDILVAVFVPGSFSGTDTVYVRAFSRNAYFSDSGQDFVTIIPSASVTPDTAQTVIAGMGDSLTYTLFLPLPPSQDTVIVTITKNGVAVDSIIVSFDTAGGIRVGTPGDTASYSDSTGILIVTLGNVPNSDTYTWGVTVQDNESGVVKTIYTDTGSTIVDTNAPTTGDSLVRRLVTIDTALTSTDTVVEIRFYDTAFGDSTSGVDSVVVIIRDTAGNVIRTDTLDYPPFYQLPVDTAGLYTLQIIVIDQAGNTTVIGDSVMFKIPTVRTIVVVAKDKDGVIQLDDVARGLNAKGGVTVTDPAANKSPTALETVMVTIVSDIDPIGITLELTENGVNTGEFAADFGFTNGVSNTSAKKIKVKDGSVVRGIYDADGASSVIAAISDNITWQGIHITNMERVRTWPNPYNPTVDPELVFHNLPPDPNMVIEVYNTNGEKVKTLRVGDGINFSANQNVAHWDGRSARGNMLASGTYIYLVRSTMGTVVRKITIVK